MPRHIIAHTCDMLPARDTLAAYQLLCCLGTMRPIYLGKTGPERNKCSGDQPSHFPKQLWPRGLSPTRVEPMAWLMTLRASIVTGGAWVYLHTSHTVTWTSRCDQCSCSICAASRSLQCLCCVPLNQSWHQRGCDPHGDRHYSCNSTCCLQLAAPVLLGDHPHELLSS